MRVSVTVKGGMRWITLFMPVLAVTRGCKGIKSRGKEQCECREGLDGGELHDRRLPVELERTERIESNPG